MHSVTEIISSLGKEHDVFPPLHRNEIIRLASTWVPNLPEDLLEFYRCCNGAALFPDREHRDCNYRLQPLDRLTTIRTAMELDDDAWFARFPKQYRQPPVSWVAINDASEGDWLALDLASHEVIDCFHETAAIPGQRTIIALSFTEFLNRAITSGGRPYWLQEDTPTYGSH